MLALANNLAQAAMRKSLCVAFVRIAELRVQALRGLRAFARNQTEFLASDLNEADYLLKFRQINLAACQTDRCSHRCRLYEPVSRRERIEALQAPLQ